MAIYQRISARRGNTVNLDVTFYRGGVPTDPYAIRKVEIYRTQVLAHNKVAEFIIDSPCDTSYPDPITKVTEVIPAGDCGTEEQQGVEVPGKYRLSWDIPNDSVVPDVYFDVWSFMPVNPCLLDEFSASTECVETTDGVVCHSNLDADELSDLIVQVCNRFWVYPDTWHGTDNLQSIRLGFEPLDQKFKQPEVRPLEVGIMPLPLYDYNYNLVAPIIPLLTATITVETYNNETIIDSAPMELAIRSGQYRTNPFVFRYNITTRSFLIGTYKYRITVTLPDGSTRVSDDFALSII